MKSFLAYRVRFLTALFSATALLFLVLGLPNAKQPMSTLVIHGNIYGLSSAKSSLSYVFDPKEQKYFSSISPSNNKFSLFVDRIAEKKKKIKFSIVVRDRSSKSVVVPCVLAAPLFQNIIDPIWIEIKIGPNNRRTCVAGRSPLHRIKSVGNASLTLIDANGAPLMFAIERDRKGSFKAYGLPAQLNGRFVLSKNLRNGKIGLLDSHIVAVGADGSLKDRTTKETVGYVSFLSDRLLLKDTIVINTIATDGLASQSFLRMTSTNDSLRPPDKSDPSAVNKGLLNNYMFNKKLFFDEEGTIFTSKNQKSSIFGKIVLDDTLPSIVPGNSPPTGVQTSTPTPTVTPTSALLVKVPFPEISLTAEQLRRLRITADQFLKLEVLLYPQDYDAVIKQTSNSSNGRYSMDQRGAEEPKWVSDANRRQFVISMADSSRAYVAASELPILALAFRVTGEVKYKNEYVTRLEEFLKGSRIQREGWDLKKEDATRTNIQNNAVWLGTGWGIRALVTSVWAMPNGSLNQDLVKEVIERIGYEAGLIESDFAKVNEAVALGTDQARNDLLSGKQWFIAQLAAHSNQWLVPVAGDVMAHWFLGTSVTDENFKNSLTWLAKSLNTLGANGEFSEGASYATLSLVEGLYASYFLNSVATPAQIPQMKEAQSKLSKFPLWLIHHIMPGDPVPNGVDSFDAGDSSFFPSSHVPMRQTLHLASASASLRGDANPSSWAISHFFPDPILVKDPPLPFSFEEYLYAAFGVSNSSVTEPAKEPILYGNYEGASHFNWRNSWNNNANGFWLRGRNAKDSHFHADCGHLSLYRHGKVIFREAGTMGYGVTEIVDYQSSSEAHNTVRFGSLGQNRAQKDLFPAVENMSNDGKSGSVVLKNIGQCYGKGSDPIPGWNRKVSWSPDSLTLEEQFTVEDEIISRKDNEPITVLWHLANDADIDVDIRTGSRSSTPSTEINRYETKVNISGSPVRIWATKPFTIQATRKKHSKAPYPTGEALSPIIEMKFTGTKRRTGNR